MNRKKILFLITKSNFGGAQRYVFDLATNLDPERYEVAVACGEEGELARRLRAHGVQVIPLGALRAEVMILKDVQAFVEILGILWRERPDVFHLNSSKAGIMGALAGRMFFVPSVIFTAHGWAFNEARPLWQKRAIKALHYLTVLFAHCTIAVSAAAVRQFDLSYARRKMRVIHNGRTAPEFLPREKARAACTLRAWELAPYAHDFWSVTIAELHPTKQHEAMIRTMKAVVTNVPNARHIIIGSGSEEQKLKKLITEYGLSEHVFLFGQLDDAARYLTAFDLFVLPSRSEAFPYALIEACYAGLPMIASKVGGIPEIVKHEQEGLLVPAGDAEALTAAYMILVNDHAKRTLYGRNARARSAHFSLSRMLAETEAVYST